MNADYCATSRYSVRPVVPGFEQFIEPSTTREMLPCFIGVRREGKLLVFDASMGQGSRIQFEDQANLQRSGYYTGMAATEDASPVVGARTVAEEVELLRQDLGLTISEIAAWMGVTRPTVYSWLKNVQPQPDSARQLATAVAAAKSIVDLELHRPGHVVKRPLFDGLSALDVLRSGQQLSEEQLAVLKQLDQREEAQRQAHTKGTPVRSLEDAGSSSAPIMRS